MSERLTITRYIAPPTHLEVQPYGTLCVVLKNDEGTEKELFLQTSQTISEPVWMSATELLQSCFGPYLQDPQIVVNLMELHQRKATIADLMAFKPQDPLGQMWGSPTQDESA